MLGLGSPLLAGDALDARERRRLGRQASKEGLDGGQRPFRLDEDTALVVKGQLGAVVGKGGVTFVDGRGIRFDNADEVALGGQLTLSYLRVGIVGNGYVFNLQERELDTLVRARETPEATPTV